MSPCGLPGCGHSPGSYGADHVSGHLKTGAGCVECSCPGYRTLEQQEAWEALMGEVGNWRMFSGTHYGSDDIHYGDAVADAADKVRSLYP